MVKINRRGSRQPRILGIDQIKIYNYTPELRKEDKELGFWSKMFGGDENFGTKVPERMIKEIVDVREEGERGEGKGEGKGEGIGRLVIEFGNVFSRKSLEFEVEEGIRKRIVEKLRVLRNWQGKEGKENDRM